MGIIVLVFCIVGYGFSWLLFYKEKIKTSVFLLLICGLLLRIYVAASDPLLHKWDERYHALVAKNLIGHPFKPTLYDNPILSYDYKDWTCNHIWLHKQPLPLWSMALSMQLFGVNTIALRMPSILFSTIGIWLTFFIGNYLFNKKVGYLAAFLFSINGLILELTAGRVATDHIDIFFLFFIELAIFLSIVYVKSHKTIFTCLAGISIGAAILSKWLPALIVLPIWLLIVIDSKTFKIKTIVFQFFILSLTCLLTFLPWQIYISHAFPIESTWEYEFNYRHIFEVLDKQTGPFYYYFDRVRIIYGEIIYLPLVWFLYKTITKPNNLKYLTVSFWFLIPTIFFSFAKTKMQAYLIFISPAIFLMISIFWLTLSEYKKTNKPKWLIKFVMILLIALPIRYSVERIKPFNKVDKSPQWLVNLKTIDNQYPKNSILFNYDRPIEAMFYTNLIAYNNLPDSDKINNLIKSGYTILINSDSLISNNYKNLTGPIIVNLNSNEL